MVTSSGPYAGFHLTIVGSLTLPHRLNSYGTTVYPGFLSQGRKQGNTPCFNPWDFPHPHSPVAYCNMTSGLVLMLS